MICGFLLTLLVPETKNKTLEELSGENDEDSMRRNFQENRRQKEIEMLHRAERLSQMEQPPAARRSHLREENGGEKWGVGTSGRSGRSGI
jgi:plasmid maintenance system killer protein